MIDLTIYLTHDNIFSLQLSSDDSPVDLIATGVTKVAVVSRLDEVDSSVDTGAIDFTTDGATGVIAFDFADIANLAVGHRVYKLLVYDTLHPAGQVWDDAFNLTVKPLVT